MAAPFAWKKITFSRLTLHGRHRNYSILRPEFVFYVHSYGIHFQTRLYVGHGELEFMVSIGLVGQRKCRKVGPLRGVNQSRACLLIRDFQKTTGAEKMFVASNRL